MNENQNKPNKDQNNDNKNRKNLRGLFVLLGWALALTIALNFLSDYSEKATVAATTHEIPYSEFIDLVEDGCIEKVVDGIAQLGLDVVHPWQETAGMSYDLYLEKYADKFAILGGVCVQSALGLLPQPQLEAEIRRVFGLLKGKRWICCTTHYVQNHCSVEDLAFAYDLISMLARE